ncbi:MAG: hypothetical protein IPF75_15495 [Bacteroidetes bacterium]|nr:hypothetical protein [Bacteroidota bacterium]
MSTSRTARLKFNYYVTKNDTKLGGNVMNDKSYQAMIVDKPIYHSHLNMT